MCLSWRGFFRIQCSEAIVFILISSYEQRLRWISKRRPVGIDENN